MPMIDFIRGDVKAFGIIYETLEEEGIEVRFGASLTDASGDVDHGKVVILRPDAFYNSRDFALPPKSVDGFVVVKCGDDYFFYVAELKSSRLADINKKSIQEKFNTIFERFVVGDFSHIFMGLDYSLKDMKLWLVCDPLNIRGSIGQPEVLKQKLRAADRLRGILADFSSTLSPCLFKGAAYAITPVLSPPRIEVDHVVDVFEQYA
jgi:hypothetical protein